MNRRNFLKSSSLASVTLTGVGVVACNDSLKTTSASNTVTDNFELNEISIDQLQKKMQDGTLSSKAITQLYLNRIDQIDKKGPALHAVIELNPDAISIAEAMDNERKEGKIRGPLHGIPVLIKDNILI